MKHEPSWQLHSVKSYSPDYLEAFTQKEYYYYFDELNRHDRHIEYYDLSGDSPIKTNTIEGLSYNPTIDLGGNYDDFYDEEGTLSGQVPLSDGGRVSQRNFLRNIPFQETTISKNKSDETPLQRSFYYHYDTKVHRGGSYYEKVTRNYNGPNCDSLANSINCEDNIVNYVAHAYSVTDSETLDDLPVGYCAYEIGVYGGSINFVENGFDFSSCPEMQADSIRLIGCNDGTSGTGGGAEFVYLHRPYKGTQMSLKDVIVQIDTVPTSNNAWDSRLDKSNNYIAFFDINGLDDEGLWEDKMVFPFDTMAIRTIDSLNHYGQIALEHNQSGIVTQYHYNKPTRIWNVNTNASTSCANLGSYSSYLSTNIGVPTAITVGYQRNDSLRTNYAYYPNYQLKSITDPNLITIDYRYDDYRRLYEAYENNRLLTRNLYHYWDRDPNDDYETRSNQNYTESFTFNDTILTAGTYNGIHAKSFIDIYGREIQTQTAMNNDQTVVISPTTQYDNWHRAVRTYKPIDTSAAVPFALDLHFSQAGDYQAFLHENNTKGRAKRSAAYGIHQVYNTHTVKQHYEIVNDLLMTCELGLSAGEVEWLVGSSLTNDQKFYKTLIEDEDGKTLTTYTNPLGQKVATLQYGKDLTDDIITLFGYDSYGNLSKVVNPEKQVSTYQYNILGQLYQQTTPDAGSTKYMYNKQGKIALKQTENGKKGEILDEFNDAESFYTHYTYDDYGRILNQEIVRFEKLIGSGVNYSEVDLMMYRDSVNGVNGNNDPIVGSPYADETYFKYRFSNRSTYDWLADISIVMPQPHPSQPGAENALISDLLGDIRYEKVYEYGHNHTNKALGKLDRLVNYDSEGKIVEVVNYTYDNNGNLYTEQIEFNPSGKNSLSGTYANPSKTVKSKLIYADYNYQKALRRTDVDINNDGSVDFQYHNEYDDWGNLAKVYFNFRDDAANKTLVTSYKYDLSTGQNIQVKHHFASEASGTLQNYVSQTITKKYDRRNRLTDQLSALLDMKLFYDNANMSGYNGQTVNASQNWNGNINGMIVSYTNIGNHSTNYSIPGQNINTGWVSEFMHPTVYGYQYDQLNRLTEADAIQGNLAVNSGSSEAYGVGDVYYQFDKIGNITSLQRGLDIKQPTTNGPYELERDMWVYHYAPGTNRLMMAAADNQNTVTRQYSYDLNGNLLTDNVRELDTIMYYRDNFPVQVNKPNQTIHYLYGTDDIRLYKKVEETGNTIEEYYLKNIGIYDMENDDWTYYVSGLSREAKIKPKDVQKPVYIAENTEYSVSDVSVLDLDFYISDYLGNTRIVYQLTINTSTLQLETVNKFMADYFPHGKTLREFVLGGERERYLTTQHERDAETKLDYRGARFYDSDMGRFLSLDPLATKFPEWSPYNYVLGNPIVYTDPDGKAPVGIGPIGKYKLRPKVIRTNYGAYEYHRSFPPQKVGTTHFSASINGLPFDYKDVTDKVNKYLSGNNRYTMRASDEFIENQREIAGENLESTASKAHIKLKGLKKGDQIVLTHRSNGKKSPDTEFISINSKKDARKYKKFQRKLYVNDKNFGNSTKFDIEVRRGEGNDNLIRGSSKVTTKTTLGGVVKL